jgi:hypothetical protein
MATTAQITANRLNSQRSTGPRTVEGKVSSSRNSIRHNLSPGATFTLLPGEDIAAFDQLVRDYRDEFQPRTAHEIFLVNQMIQAQWRISRIERLQAEVLDIILNVPAAEAKSDEAAIVASMGFAHGQALDRLERYGRAAERAYFRANKELKQYRAEKQNEAKSAAVTAQYAQLVQNGPYFQHSPAATVASRPAPPHDTARDGGHICRASDNARPQLAATASNATAAPRSEPIVGGTKS